MQWSETEISKINDHIDKKEIDKLCPECNEFLGIHPHCVGISTVDLRAKEIHPGAAVPLVALNCPQCGYFKFLDANLIFEI